MRSGGETLSGIEEALRDLKTQEDALRRELTDAAEQGTKLATARLEALKELAALRARAAVADGVITDADNLSDQMAAALAARLRTMAQLSERQASAESERDALLRREANLKLAIEVLEDRLDRFGAQAKQALSGEARYAEASARHASLMEMLKQATSKAEQVTRDEHEKGAPYRGDPLFMYLWQRQYGSAGYTATGLVRALDDWVAGLVRYQDARANYAMLTEIPVRLRAHAEALREQTGSALAVLEEMEADKTRELAGTDLIGELRAERAKKSALDKELEQITSELAETGSQLKTYAKGEDRAFQTAVQTYAKFLEREPLRSLIHGAATTPGKEDDLVVGEVRRIGSEIDELENIHATRRQRLDQISERRMELARLASNFRRQRYDDVASEFDDSPDLEDLLQLLLRGAITAAEYWVRMQSQQHWRHRPADPWRRQSGLPPFGGFPGGWSGGSWSGGGGSRGGSRGGGDFETGGRF